MNTQKAQLNSNNDDVASYLEFVINATGVAIWDWQIQTGELTFNDRWAEIIGYKKNELHPINFSTWATKIHPDDLIKANSLRTQYFNDESGIYHIEIRIKHKLGHYVWVQVSGKLVERDKDNNPKRMLGTHLDISERKSDQRKLEQTNIELSKVNSELELSAHYDPLTKLPNRNLLADRIEHAVKRSVRNKKMVAVSLIDLDGFKAINDNHGHDIGDKFLKEISRQLKDVLRDGDTLSRFGGDEFVAVIDDLANPLEGDSVISRMLDVASAPLLIDNIVLKVTASIGTTFYPLDNASPDQLLRHADQAMYKAKQHGKNQNYTFDIEQDAAVIHHNEELKRIRKALKDDEFQLYYQPKIDLRSNELVGVEALIRWNHPERGIVPPGLFLPVVEHDLLDIEIGKWVITTAFKQSKKWTSLGHNIPISVNISPLHLQHPDFVSDLKNTIDKYPNFKFANIEFEILESSALKDIELVSKVMEACGKLGVTFSIDDFGTGYSSLTYLKRLPAKYLKIDQSFIRDMLDDVDDKAIVEGIIQLAKVFNLKTIAEGVETAEHGELLLSLGNYIAQGYGVSKPIPESNVLTWLEKWKEKPQLIDGREQLTPS